MALPWQSDSGTLPHFLETRGQMKTRVRFADRGKAGHAELYLKGLPRSVVGSVKRRKKRALVEFELTHDHRLPETVWDKLTELGGVVGDTAA